MKATTPKMRKMKRILSSPTRLPLTPNCNCSSNRTTPMPLAIRRVLQRSENTLWKKYRSPSSRVCLNSARMSSISKSSLPLPIKMLKKDLSCSSIKRSSCSSRRTMRAPTNRSSVYPQTVVACQTRIKWCPRTKLGEVQ